MPKLYENYSGCCKEASMWISWEKKPEPKLDKRGRRIGYCQDGPERDGWSLALGDNFSINVKFCPWCGKKLEDGQ